MKVPRRVAGVLGWAEDALDRLKLRYKERFDRFDPARPVPYRGWGRPDQLVLRGRARDRLAEIEADRDSDESGPSILERILTGTRQRHPRHR